YPADYLDIAQAAGGIFDIGLEVIFGVVVLLVTQNLLIPFRAKKFIGGPKLLRRRQILQLGTQRLIPHQRARLHDIGGDSNIIAGNVHALFNGAYTVAYFQAYIPQQGKKALDIVAAVRQDFRLVQNQQVNIGKGMKLAATITAHGFEADARRPVKLVPGVMQNAVDKQGAFIHQGAYIFALTKTHIELPVGGRQSVFEYRDNRLFTQRPTKAALIKKEQRSFEVGRRGVEHDLDDFPLAQREHF